jgi:hypothetical protein
MAEWLQGLASEDDDTLNGLTARANTNQLERISDGDVVFISATVNPGPGSVAIRIIHAALPSDQLLVSPSVWERLQKYRPFDVGEKVVSMRPLTGAERMRRRVSVKHATVILAVIAALLTAIVAILPLILVSPDAAVMSANNELANTEGWRSGHLISRTELEGLGRARDALSGSSTYSPFDSPLRVGAAICALLAAISATIVGWRTAEEQV